MKTKLTTLIVLVLLISVNASAQYGGRKKSQEKFTDNMAFGLGFASMSFHGEMNKVNPIPTLYINRPGVMLFAEKRFGDYIGVGLHGLYGSVTHNQRTVEPSTNLNFESNITQVGATVSFHTDNSKWWKTSSSLSPFVSAGFGWTFFDPHGDLQDANGNDYYYWENGYIYDRPEASDSLGQAVQLNRDYTYETTLNDSSDYSRNTFAIPVTFGLKWKLSNSFQFRATATYTFTGSDFIDNYSIDNRNDAYLFTGISAHYVIGAKDNSKERGYEKVDFQRIRQNDEDGDGILDWEDDCPGSHAADIVDKNGCPEDSDGDGVTDRDDEEPNTKPGASVNEQGVTIPFGEKEDLETPAEGGETDGDGGE